MSRKAKPVFVDPSLEQQWLEAFTTRPAGGNALAAWNREHGDLVKAYQEAVERGQREEQAKKKARAKRRRKIASAIIGTLLTIGGIIYWATRPSEDEIRYEHQKQSAAICNTHYELAHHIKMVSRQVDLLQNGEGGWLEFPHPPYIPQVVGGVTLTPSELGSGKTGQAQLDREAYAFDSTLGSGGWALVERKNGQLVLTLIAIAGSFGDLPHAPLQTGNALAVTVQGDMGLREC